MIPATRLALNATNNCYYSLKHYKNISLSASVTNSEIAWLLWQNHVKQFSQKFPINKILKAETFRLTKSDKRKLSGR